MAEIETINGNPIVAEVASESIAPVVDAAVDAWLTAHPEATTTVQDGSITKDKLDSDLREKIGFVELDGTTTTGSYVTYSGGLSANANFSYYLVYAEAGITLYADNLTSTANVAVISKQTGESTYQMLVQGEGSSSSPSLKNYEYTVQTDGWYAVSWRNNTAPVIYGYRINIDDGSITDSMLSGSGVKKSVTELGYVNLSPTVHTGSYVNASGVLAANVNYSYADGISLQAGDILFVKNVNTTSGVSVVSLVDGATITPLLIGKGSSTVGYGPYDYRYEVKATGSYYLSWRNGGTPNVYAIRPEAVGRLYVSTTGSDAADGGQDAPLATVQEAIDRGAHDIAIFGGDYHESINLSRMNGRVRLFSIEQTGRVRFYPLSNYLATATSATTVSGYTKVKRATLDKAIGTANAWIYQDSVDDAETAIVDSERHPLQRGKFYRCEDTRIVRCAATVQEEALAEIEAANDYRFFQNGATIYFSSPQEVNAEHPICASMSNRLFVLPSDRRLTVEMLGIESKYSMVDISNTIGSRLVDCKVSNVYGSGGFIYGGAIDAEFLRCEVSRIQTSGGGDGFNAHSNPTGEVFSKQTTCTMVDCWSHDNNDDGYSDHERSETTIIGGLYEYNGKAGVTPSYGSHCTCYNVHSRRNYSGFIYTGATAEAEGGNDGQMELFGCLSENNTRGTGNYGYCVRGGGNVAKLVNCKSTGNAIGYFADADDEMHVIDCGSYGDTEMKSGNVSATVTSVVS